MSMLQHLLTTPKIAKTAYISHASHIIGNVTIGDHSSVWPMAVIRGDMEKIMIGYNTNIQDGSVLHTTHSSDFHSAAPLTIGNNVTIGHGCVIHGCQIEDLCLIGIKSTILDHAIIQPYTLIGANSLVPPNKILESGFLWLGAPVKKIRPLTEAEVKFFQYSANNYVELKQHYQNNHL